MKTLRILAILALSGCLFSDTPTYARTKLVTLPDRAASVMSLENPNHAILYEEREIPLQAGTNSIDFSWSGVSIDSKSVLIEFLDHPGDGTDATKIIATGYPPNENALTWQIYSPEARTERVRVSYVLYGITQETSYEMRVNSAETQGVFQQHLLLRNSSGEDLDDTVVRLPLMDDLTRSVDSGEVRRFQTASIDELPITKLYVSKPGFQTFAGEDGENISLVYEIKNDAASGLGAAKLPLGKSRIFGEFSTTDPDGEEETSTIFLGEDMLKQTPPGEKAELTLGTVKDVSLKRFLVEDKQVPIMRNDSRRVVLMNVERTLRYEVENFKNQPVTLKIHEPVNGEWEVADPPEDWVRYEKKAIDDFIIYIDLPAVTEGEEVEKREVEVAITLKNRFPNEN